MRRITCEVFTHDEVLEFIRTNTVILNDYFYVDFRKDGGSYYLERLSEMAVCELMDAKSDVVFFHIHKKEVSDEGT